METPRKVTRFSSCRGVSFEIRSHPDPFSPTAQPSSKIFPFTDMTGVQRSLSRPSSHFCDVPNVQNEENKVEQMFDDVENQTQGTVLVAPQADQTQQGSKPSRQKQSRLSIILLDQGIFTVYKRLFVMCLAVNITGLALAHAGHFPYAKHRAALFAIGNMLALTMCRSEAILRVVYWLAVKIIGRPSVPFVFKTCTTSFLQCIGGVHSSCGVSSIMWLVYAIALILKNRRDASEEIVMVSFAILGLICLSSLAAFPVIRHLHHNVFERTHRFTGWTALLLLWALIILTISYDPVSNTYSDHILSRLLLRQEFWFTFVITVLIVLPWLTVRRVPVNVYAPSGHASVIKFNGGIKAGLLGRISTSPFSEWHAFGIISDGQKEHIMLAGAVGEFTKSLITNPPTHLWIRTVHFAGLPYLVNMYNKVVLVATGSGICVFLSFLLQPSKADVHMIWVAKEIEKNFGSEIKEIVDGYCKDKIIVHDTAVLGRPNVAEMSVAAAKKWDAEAVIVTSNPEGSRDVVDACNAAGIAAFGPIWDS